MWIAYLFGIFQLDLHPSQNMTPSINNCTPVSTVSSEEGMGSTTSHALDIYTEDYIILLKSSLVAMLSHFQSALD